MKKQSKRIILLSVILFLVSLFISCSGAVGPDSGNETANEQASGTGGASPSTPPAPPVYYTVTFNSDGGNDIEAQSVQQGNTVTRPEDPVRNGYLFCGWFLSNTLYDFASPVNSAITLIAKWEAISPDDIIINSSTENIVQTITAYTPSAETTTINIKVIGQINNVLSQTGQGLTTWAENYFNTNRANPTYNINIDLRYATGITELTSNCISIGTSTYEANLNYVLKLPSSTTFIATDAFNSVDRNKVKLLIGENLYTIAAPQNDVLKLYNEQRKNTLSFTEGVSLEAVSNGVNVTFFKNKVFVPTTAETKQLNRLLIGSQELLFYYYPEDFTGNEAKFFIPFSDAGKSLQVIFYPRENSNYPKSIDVEPLGGIGFPIKQAFYDTGLLVSCDISEEQVSVKQSTQTQSLSDWFVDTSILYNNYSNFIHYNIHLGNNNWYAYNNILFNSQTGTGYYQKEDGNFEESSNIINYISSNFIKCITDNSSVNFSNYLNQTCTATMSFYFTLNDEHYTEFYAGPISSGYTYIDDSWNTGKLPKRIESDNISEILQITENTKVKLMNSITAENIRDVGDALRQLSLSHPEFRIYLDLRSCNITEIPRETFKDCTVLGGIIFNSNIRRFNYHSFSNCPHLHTVNYSGTLGDWLNTSFEAGSNPCCNGADLTINNQPVTELTIPDTITSLGNYAFSSCETLKKVTIPDTVTAIGACAFSTCHNLESIVLSNTVETIGIYTFYECNKLTNITIPASVNRIEKSAFQDCYNLDRVIFRNTSGWKAYKSDGTNVSIDVSNPSAAASYLRSPDSNFQYYYRETGD